MAGKGELESATEAGAMNADGDRLRKARHAVEHFLAVGRQSFSFGGGAERDELFDIGARDEVLGFAGEKGDRADPGVVGERREAGQELILDRSRNDVDRLALQVENDGRDAIADIPGDGGRGARPRRSDRRHQRRSSTIANPTPARAQTEMKPNSTPRR